MWITEVLACATRPRVGRDARKRAPVIAHATAGATKLHMKLDLALISVLLGTATIIGCAPAQPAQAPSEHVSTTQLTSADAPMPQAPRTPLLGWYTPETDAQPRPAKRPLDASDPWASAPALARPAQPAESAPAEKAASPAVAPQ
jgi:hypothetical protein